MIKKFTLNIKKSIKTFFPNYVKRFNFSEKNPEIDDPDEKKDFFSKFSNTIKTGDILPYIPLSDHPLFPGLSQVLYAKREMISQMDSLEIFKKPVFISVLKDPNKVEALMTKDE